MHSENNALPKLAVKRAVCEIVGFLRRMTFSCNRICVLGLSGGVDSSTVAYLLVEAIGKDNIRIILMPYHQTSKRSMDDALLVVNELKLKYQVIDISASVDKYFYHFPEAEQIRRGNKMARERMSILYDMALFYNGLVIGTGNKSELFLGYFTKYGDGGVDLEPLGALYKTYVYELAKYLGVPEKIINKPPTADLWSGQMDEDELGIKYEVADQILYFLTDIGEDTETIIQRGFNKDYVNKVVELVKYSDHKRKTPPIPDMPLAFHEKCIYF